MARDSPNCYYCSLLVIIGGGIVFTYQVVFPCVGTLAFVYPGNDLVCVIVVETKWHLLL